jgi:hypothetical protein
MKSRSIAFALVGALLFIGPLSLLVARGGHGGGGHGGGRMHGGGHGGGRGGGHGRGHHGGGHHGHGGHGGSRHYGWNGGGYGYWAGGIWFPLAATAAVGIAAGAAVANSGSDTVIVEESQPQVQALDENGSNHWRVINQSNSQITVRSDNESVVLLPGDGDRLNRKYSFDFVVDGMPFRSKKHVIVFYRDEKGRLNIATYPHRRDVPTLVPGSYVSKGEDPGWTYRRGYRKTTRQ